MAHVRIRDVPDDVWQKIKLVAVVRKESTEHLVIEILSDAADALMKKHADSFPRASGSKR